MARYRKTAIAALAASALLLTPTAAYADHNHHRGVNSYAKGMSWAYTDADVTDYTTDKNEVFKGAKASAFMIGMDGKSFFRLRVTGIEPKTDPYGVHLHVGECVEGNPGTADIATGGAGPHYNANWNPTGPLSDNEVWLDLTVNSDGVVRSTATVDFIPEKGTRSIVFHANPTVSKAVEGGPAVGSAGPRLACLPFEVESLRSK